MCGRDVLNAANERLTALFYAGFGIHTEVRSNRRHRRDYSLGFPRENIHVSRENCALGQYRLKCDGTLIERRQKVRNRLDVYFTR